MHLTLGTSTTTPIVSEQDIQEELGATAGGWYVLYEARIFASGWETHVEHIVAVSEAHDSGLCGRTPEEKQTFGADLNNVILASPELNFEKGYYDAGEWLPPNAKCWFARTAVFVKQTHRLSVDEAERDELERVLSTCERGEVPPRYADEEPESPPVLTFRNCATMREAGWYQGVNRNGGTYRAAWDAAETETYGRNTARDRDRDGRGCE